MSLFSPFKRRVEAAAYRTGLDRLFFHIWRLSPFSLRQWMEHHRFDRRLKVNTRGYRDLRYEPTPAGVFGHIMTRLDIDFGRFVFIDFGSGKGKVLLLASELPFKRVVGVERFEDLHRIAQENLQRLRHAPRACGALESVLVDAASYVIPPEPAVLYFFNPFGEDVLRRVLENIEASLVRLPREIIVIFYAPVRRDTPWDRHRVFEGRRALERVRDEKTFTIYFNKEGPRARLKT